MLKNLINNSINIIIKNKLYKETSWSFLTKGIAALLFLALNVFLARYLGAVQFGAWSYFFSILNILLLISYFGINSSAQKYIAQYNQTDRLKSVLKSSLKLRFFYSLVFSIFVLLTYKFLASLFDRPDFEMLFLASVPFIFLTGFVELFKHVFQGLHRLKYSFIIVVSEYGLKLIFSIIFLIFINGIITIIHAFNSALIITAIIGTYIFFSRFYSKILHSDESFDKDIFIYSLPLFLTGIGFVIFTEIDTLMIGILSTDFDVGVYALAKQIIIKLPHIAYAISLGIMPLFAKLNVDNKEKLKMLLFKLLRINSLIYAIIVAVILSSSWHFIPAIFGQEYSESVTPLMVLSIYLLFKSYAIFLSSFLDYQGKVKKRAVYLSLAILINILLNLILIPKYGATGAAIATSVSYIPYVLLSWVETKRTLA